MDTGTVLQPGPGQRPVEAAVRGEVLVAAQVQGPAGGADQVGALLGVDLVQRPGPVKVVDVPVVVPVGQAGPGPFRERAVAVDGVVGKGGQQGGPAGDAPAGALFGAEGVGGVDRRPQGVRPAAMSPVALTASICPVLAGAFSIE